MIVSFRQFNVHSLVWTIVFMSVLLFPLSGMAGDYIVGPGDVLKITFPGAATLNTSQAVRRDGKIALPFVGELAVVGLTPAEVEKAILKLYDAQLVTKEVSVAVETSSFPIFVTGAAVRP